MAQRRGHRSAGDGSHHSARRVHHVVPLARNAPVVHDQAPQPLRRAVVFMRLEGLGVHKVLGELRDPAQPSSNGRSAVVDVVAVEAESHFHAQRVSCAKSAWRHTGFQQGFPDGSHPFGRHVNLHAACAGVACGRHQDVLPEEHAFREGVISQFFPGLTVLPCRGQLPQDALRLWTLKRD